MASAAPVVGAVAGGVQAVGSIVAGQQAAAAASANAILQQGQGIAARVVGDTNARTIEAQGAYNAAEIERRAALNVGEIAGRTDFNAAVIQARGDFNAALAMRTAGDIQTDTALREQQTRLGGEMLLGEQRARAAASGVTFEGSPLEVFQFQARENELAALTVRMQGNANRFDAEAAAIASRLEAEAAAAAARLEGRSAADLMMSEAASEAAATRFDAAGRASTLRLTGQQQEFEGSARAAQSRAQGSAARTGSYFQAAGDVLGAAAKFGPGAVSTARGWFT
jgi:hypothetical protein